MKTRRFLIATFFLPALAFAKPEAFFDSDVALQAKVVDQIKKSRSTIDIAATNVNARPIVNALHQAAARKVRVRILGDAGLFFDKKMFAPSSRIQIRLTKGRNGKGSLMQRHFALFDRRRALTGTANWTTGKSAANYDNILIEDDPALAANYARQFDQLWIQKPGAPLAAKKSTQPARKKK